MPNGTGVLSRRWAASCARMTGWSRTVRHSSTGGVDGQTQQRRAIRLSAQRPRTHRLRQDQGQRPRRPASLGVESLTGSARSQQLRAWGGGHAYSSTQTAGARLHQLRLLLPFCVSHAALAHRVSLRHPALAAWHVGPVRQSPERGRQDRAGHASECLEIRIRQSRTPPAAARGRRPCRSTPRGVCRTHCRCRRSARGRRC